MKRYWSVALAVAICSATTAFAQIAQDQVRRAAQNQAIRQAAQEQAARRAAQDRAAQEQARQAAQDQAERRAVPDQPGSQNVQNQAGRQAAQPNQIPGQQLIMELYFSNFRSTVGISEDQWFKVGPAVRQFIQTRFRVANQRALLNQRRMELLAQANPAEAEVQRLKEDQAQIEQTSNRAENNLLNRLRSELRSDLSPRQELLVQAFNKTFFEERLPQLLERAREEAARPQAPQQARPNANKNKAPAVESFRER